MDGVLRMPGKERLRRFAMRHLSQSRYVEFAAIYNEFASCVKELRMRKPLDRLIDCGLPLIYISQPARSGGTLVRNLFDGHPECHVFPHELSWQKNGYSWDDSLTIGLRSFHVLRDKWLGHAIVNGLDKRIPFYFKRRLQKQIFLQGKKRHPRSVLDRYFTSFFNSWVNYQNLCSRGKKYCVAFCPSNLQSVDEIERFFKIYPEGFRIQVVRNPLGWWASEKAYGSRQNKRLRVYLGQRWVSSVETGIQARQLYPENYILVSYDGLVERPEQSLRELCDKTGIAYNEVMLCPTINCSPRLSNTSFGEGTFSIDSSSLPRWRESLSSEEIDTISDKTDSLYKEALSWCVNRAHE